MLSTALAMGGVFGSAPAAGDSSPCESFEALITGGNAGQQASSCGSHLYEIVGDLGEGFSGGINVEPFAPPTVLETQKYGASVKVSTTDTNVAAVVEILASTPDPHSDPCHSVGFSIEGGLNLGNNLYVILPESASFGLESVPSGSISVTWKLVADVPGRCIVELDVDNPLDNVSPGPLHLITDILPEISATQIDLGHIETIGGQTKIDQAKTVTPPAASKIEITSTTSRVLAVASGTISHNDGWSWKDRGHFEIKPAPNASRLVPIPGVIPDLGAVKYKMILDNDGDTIKPWLAIVDLAASAAGTSNTICMTGQYEDTGTMKGKLKEHCVEVVVTQNTNLVVDSLPEALQPLAQSLLERFGCAFIPTGAPNTFYYLEDLEDPLGGDG